MNHIKLSTTVNLKKKKGSNKQSLADFDTCVGNSINATAIHCVQVAAYSSPPRESLLN